MTTSGGGRLIGLIFDVCLALRSAVIAVLGAHFENPLILTSDYSD